MRYMATIYVSDILTDVACTLEVQAWEDMYGAPETVLQHTFVWAGVGDDDAGQWLERGCRRLLRDLSNAPSESRNGAPLSGGTHTISGL